LLVSVNAEGYLLPGGGCFVKACEVIDRGHALAAKCQDDVECQKTIGRSLASRWDGNNEGTYGVAETNDRELAGT
jgi:hypothetical protein